MKIMHLEVLGNQIFMLFKKHFETIKSKVIFIKTRINSFNGILGGQIIVHSIMISGHLCIPTIA